MPSKSVSPLYLLLSSLLIFFEHSLAQCPTGWSASTSVPGKCYSIATVDLETYSEDFQNLVMPCRSLLSGADILAIVNGFENQEIASLIRGRSIDNAMIGITVLNGEVAWFSTTGFSNYTSNIVPRKGMFLPGISVYSDAHWDWNWSNYVLCQYYPNAPENWATPLANCPPEWANVMSAPEKCVQLVGQSMDYSGAVETCSQYGANVVSARRMIELHEMYDSEQHIWTSYNRLDNDSDWHWSSARSSNYEPLLYNVSSTKQCAYFDNYIPSIFYAIDCAPNDSELSIYCEIFPGQSATTTTTTAASTARPTTKAGPSCPDNWLQSSIIPLKCYAVIQQDTNFGTARSLCQLLHDDATLLTIWDDREVDLLAEDAGTENSTVYFIGLQANGAQQWQWIGDGGAPIDLWGPNQPDNQQNSLDTCGALAQGQYYSVDCLSRHEFVCQLVV